MSKAFSLPTLRYGLRKGVVFNRAEAKGGKFASEVDRHVATHALLAYNFLVHPRNLVGFSRDELEALISAARSASGADEHFTPMYQGFPTQVRDMSTLDLFIDQIVHYWSFGTLVPVSGQSDTMAPRAALPMVDEALTHAKRLTVMQGSRVVAEYVRSLMASPVVLSDDDRDGMALLAATLPADDVYHIAESLLTFVRNNENLSVSLTVIRDVLPAERINDVAQALLRSRRGLSPERILRIVLALYSAPVGTDNHARAEYEKAVINLLAPKAAMFRMVSMPMGVRRTLVRTLGQQTFGYRADDLVGARNAFWRSVMKSVHPYRLGGRSQSLQALRPWSIIANNIEHETLASRYERAIASGSSDEVCSLIEAAADNGRSGMVMKNVGTMLRAVGVKSQSVVARSVADNHISVNSSAPLVNLIGYYNGFIALNFDGTRTIRGAGVRNITKAYGEDRHVSQAAQKIVVDATRKAIVANLARTTTPSSDVVGVGGESAQGPVALIRRDSATTDRELFRGQRIDIDSMGTPGAVIRLFVHWVNTDNERVDLDLGGVLLDDDFNQIATVTWNSYASSRQWATFSGDMTNAPAPHGAAEYIDVDIDQAKRFSQARYVAGTVLSFTGQPLGEVDHVSGVMFRSEPDSGEIFEPRSVHAAGISVSEATHVVSVLFDMEKNQMVWVDTDNGSRDGRYSATDMDDIGSMIRDELARPRMSVGELAKLYAQAHGLSVSTKHDADPRFVESLLN